MKTRVLVLACVSIIAMTTLIGSVAAQDFVVEPTIPKDYDEENNPPIVYEDRRFNFNIEHNRDLKMFQTEVWYPHEYVNLTVVPATTAWDLDITRQNRDSRTKLTVRGDLSEDYVGQGYPGSTMFKLHVTVEKELRYATLNVIPFRIETADGVPTDFTTEDATEQQLEVYPYPRPESDIEVTDVEVSPREVALGDRISVAFEAENSGDAQGTHTAEMLVDGESVGESKEFTLGGGEKYSWEFWYTFEPGEYEPGEYEVSVEGEPVTVEVLSSGLLGIEVVGEEYGSLSAAGSGVASAGSEGTGLDANATGNTSGGSDVQATGGDEGRQMPGFTAAVAVLAVLFAAAYRIR